MIALIADDLTGASDAAVQFARRGLATHVMFDLTQRDIDAAVLAVDTDTRKLSAAEGYRRVREVASRLRDLEPERVYKKIDSTLRGNLGAELDGVMDAFEFRLAIIAPAFPKMGRTTRHGIHHLHGRPVHETEIGRDPITPVRESNVIRLLRAQSRRSAGLLSCETTESGPQAIRDEVEAHARRRVSLLVCDAETDDALHDLVEGLGDRPDVLWVGSAGLSEDLAAAWSWPCTAKQPTAARPDQAPVLLVAGSTSETTQRQVAALAARPGVAMITLDPARLSDGDAERYRGSLKAALETGGDCALVLDPRANRAHDSERLADLLGAIAAEGIRQHRLAGLILTGGETARAVCRHVSASGIRLLAEVEPGVPLGVLVSATAGGLPVVTKAGAFGSDHTLLEALHQLKGDR